MLLYVYCLLDEINLLTNCYEKWSQKEDMCIILKIIVIYLFIFSNITLSHIVFHIYCYVFFA